MQTMHSKKMMLLHLQGKEADDGYKRKKLKLPAPVVNNVQTISDMEIEDVEGIIINYSLKLNKYYHYF